MDLTLDSRIKVFADIIGKMQVTHNSKMLDNSEHGIREIVKTLQDCQEINGSIILLGNGGSAAIAAHVAIDLINMAHMRAFTLQEVPVITCISNDYGYEYVYARQIQSIIRQGDVVIAISSSGSSKNILNAVSDAKRLYANIISFSGFSKDNPLRKLGDINVWLDSQDYGMVEIGHSFILHNITDRLGLKQKLSININTLSDEVIS